MPPTTRADDGAERVRAHLLALARALGCREGPPTPCAAAAAARGNVTPWVVALVTLVLVLMLHLHRFWWVLSRRAAHHPHHRAPVNVWREGCILALGLVGLALFWAEVRCGRFYEGLLRLILFVGLANVLVPALWAAPVDLGAVLEEEADGGHHHAENEEALMVQAVVVA